MDELGIDIGQIISWFPHVQDAPYVLVRVSEDQVRIWSDALGVPVRRCYITDAILEDRAAKLNVPKAEVLAAKLPDPGATMAGDFGEILVYFYQASKEYPHVAFGPKKWRLKQDRTKPAPLSDVIHFVLPSWPTPSEQDLLLCSEVKTKSTNGASTPIKAAIEDSVKDRTGRLVRTLVWLKERALAEDIGNMTIAHLDRFIKASDHPRATKRFRAVAVICDSLVEQELSDAPVTLPKGYSVVVISVPDLKKTYTRIYEAAHKSALEAANPSRSGGLR